jgi:hypothetical protein
MKYYDIKNASSKARIFYTLYYYQYYIATKSPVTSLEGKLDLPIK